MGKLQGILPSGVTEGSALPASVAFKGGARGDGEGRGERGRGLAAGEQEDLARDAARRGRDI